MHRRSFVTLLATAPLATTLPGAGILDLHAVRRFRPAPGSQATFAWIGVEVYLARSERAARGLRNREAHDPFDGLRGEFYVSGAHSVDIPDDIPGSVTTYETVAGVAAQEGVIHVGGVRRGVYVWVIRVNGGAVDPVLHVVDLIMGYDLPDETDARLNPVLLRSLLPDTDDFPVEVRIEGES